MAFGSGLAVDSCYNLAMPEINKELYKRQIAHILAEEEVDDKGHITVYALGGFVPENGEEQAAKFLQLSPPYRRKMARGATALSTAKAENEYRLLTTLRINDFLKALHDTGCNVSRAAKVSGLNRTMATHLRARVPAFANLWQEVFDSVTDKLEEAGIKRAVEGVEEDIFYQGIACGKRTVYSDSLLSMMLQGRRSDIYKARIAQEVTGMVKGGERIDLSHLSTIELERYYTLLDEMANLMSKAAHGDAPES